MLQPDFLRLRLSSGAAQKAEKLFAYRKRRPERPPAGTIACHTKRPKRRYRVGAGASITARTLAAIRLGT